MPIYLYCCEKCENEITVIRKISDRDLDQECEKCLNPKMKRVMGASSFRLKGGGWYNEGYSKRGD